jgi:long-chain acyl-CoA synthetase
MSGQTIFQLFEDAARSNRAAAALVLGDRQVTYARLAQDIALATRKLVRERAGSGPVIIMTDDPFSALKSFFAAAAVGRPALPLDPGMPTRTMALFESLAADDTGVPQKPPHPALRAALSREGRGLKAEVGATLASPTREPSWRATSKKSSGEGSRRRLVGEGAFAASFDPSHTEFYWGLTSGTTGDPKLFARSHGSWTASFEAAETVFDFPPRSQILVPRALHHSLFLYGAVHGLCRGHTVILPGHFRPNRIAETARQATHLYAVPFMLGEMLKARVQAPALRTIFSGGAKLASVLRRECEERWPDADLVEFYGASETSFVTFHSTRNPASEGSVGRPFPDVSIEIRGENGEALQNGRTGRIFVKSPMLFARYIGEAPTQTWFSAGDTGYFDTAGCLHLTGRTNRMIKSKGLKIHPEAIEAALLALPQVHRAAVVDLPDAARGAVAVAAIEFASGTSLPRKSLAAHCRQMLGRSHCPRSYFAADCLPLTRSGKIAVAEVRRALSARHTSYREIT